MTDPRENDPDDRFSSASDAEKPTSEGQALTEAAGAAAAPNAATPDAGTDRPAGSTVARSPSARTAPIARKGGASLARALSAALVAAGVSAILGLLFSVLTLFSANQPGAAVLVTLLDYWTVHTLIAFVLLAALAGVGAYRKVWSAIVGSALAAVVAALLGSLVGAMGQGATLTGDIVGPLLETILGLNLMFVLGVSLASVLLGRRLWLRLSGAAEERPRERVALVRIPSSRLAEGELTHLQRQPVDAELADQQWERYVLALEEHGWATREVPPADANPDSVFVEDAVVVLGGTAVVLTSGADSRRDERPGVERLVGDLGLDVVSIDLPATVDGGDVLEVGSTLYVGSSSRTNAAGIRRLREIAGPLGYAVVAVPVSSTLHLKSQVTALPDGTVIGYEPLVDEARLFPSFLAVPEAAGTAVVALDEHTLLLSAAAPRTADLLRSLGYEVVTVDISEFEKLEGCVTCLSVRIG
ncbi:N(G),N(G)-dimethylarginine dimethylaminohydrolase [Clavibacter michiganensis]|uniref:N(G),N(G)-dimethylarginine dimethylaminohydrolase n=1 Tax=Clavibacter michiganensis TaxID=28447 RepID=A0A251YEJ6_9MICO|nr:dimethylargininase [Clavibacter michiganensis]OUE22661.1 N(G),N(G)-dimethylarginine dimethylaminohydrolase [Clavibacter michiganensis]